MLLALMNMKAEIYPQEQYKKHHSCSEYFNSMRKKIESLIDRANANADVLMIIETKLDQSY